MKPLLKILAGLVPLVIFLTLPPAAPLTAQGMRAIGVFLCTITWWVLIGVDYPSVMCLVLLAALGVMTPAAVFANSFGHWLTLLLIGSFGLCEALRGSGFTKRFSLWFLTRPCLRGRPWLLLGSFFLACTLMGAVMSSTVTCLVFMTIAISIFNVLGYKRGDPFASLIMIGVAWAATASHAMSPVSHAGNLLVIAWIRRDLGRTITFLDWMTVGVPAGLLFCCLLVWFFRSVIRPDIRGFTAASAEYAARELAESGQMSRQEKISVGVFLAVFLAWVAPDIIGGRFPGPAQYLSGLGFALPALAGAGLLCFARSGGRPLLDFNRWFAGGVEWSSVTLVATILALGAVINDPGTGIAAFLTGFLGRVTAGMSFAVFLPLVMLWVIGQTNLVSNIVSMTLVYSIAVPVAAEAGFGDPAALGVTIAAASNYAFALPSATTTTALVAGSGWASPRQMFRYGIMLLIPTVIFFSLFFYPFAAFILR